ncbi:MAG TPA: amidohydrolase family protein [Acidimicrobiales bacterium]|nr:amidohydrolase family protein [Acidimicrobiales bacterium]
MEIDDLVLVSTDDHVVEPPDMFAGRLPSKYADRAPRVVGDNKGLFNWVFDGHAAPSLTTAATAGRGKGDHDEPTSYEDIRPGTYNIHERVKDMDANGVLGSLCFPSFPRFAGQLFAEAAQNDVGLALAAVRAYNDWHIEEWCGAYPERSIPCALVPIWDPQLMAEEIRRVSAKGVHAVTFSMNPYMLGLPSLHDTHWDPFWAACEELEVVVCLHIGSGSFMIQTSPDAPMLTRVTCSGINIYPTAADLIWSPMMHKFPGLQFALSEGGIGWVPYFLERADYTYKHHVEYLPDHPFYGRWPSEQFNERFITCFIDDEHGVRNLDLMNIDNVTWECDYPHPDSTWPNSPEEAWRYLRLVGDDTRVDKITHLNAMRIFHYDPFSLRPREQCTVAALRAHAGDHDVSFVPGRLSELALTTQGGTEAHIVGPARP